MYCNTNAQQPSLASSPVTIHLVYCDTNFPQPSSLPIVIHQDPLHPHVAIQSPIAIHFPLAKNALLSQYNGCIMTHSQPSPTALQNLLCHNTISHCIVTQLGSSPTNFLHHFFFRFSYTFFFIYFHLLENHPKKIHIHFFSSFSSTPNKFIKIYFHSFSLVLHTIKTLENDFLHSFLFFFSHFHQ